MERPSTIYKAEKPKEHLVLTDEQKDFIRMTTSNIEEVDDIIKSMAMEDAVKTMENGHPLNRIITDKEGKPSGYIACEDFVPSEAYIKYFGTNKQTGRNLLKEVPAFFEYAKQQGYSKLNFHGWNGRLNRILEHFGFQRIRTDSMNGFSADFYEKSLVEQKTSETINEDRKKAFEQKYINKLNQEYEQTIKTFRDDNSKEKEKTITDTFQILSGRLASVDGMEFKERQKAVLKLKLARYFQNNENIDINSIYDAIIETPNFINTDKGSLHRLFEIHEQKTLEKIAEMRKKRAEMKKDGTFNPYENLFTTKSGKYYLARLLNMPHLQEESEYMNHCVGTSDSYVNKIKRGEVEILSFRDTKNDKPIMTIEYNLKTKEIEQMKKVNDEFLKSNDLYYDDVINALKQFRNTQTDTGELRDFSKISPSELGNIKVNDYCILTEHGEISFRDFNLDEGVFILKTGKMEITSEISNEDAVKIIQIGGGVKFKSEELARNKKEINDQTKIYIGPLSKEILQYNIENIYTSFPEGKIERGDIEIGGMTEEELEREIKNTKDEQSRNYQINSYAESMMKHPDFLTSVKERLKKPETINLVKLKVRDLGFTNNPTTDELYAKAEELGLELCPAETGPHLRLKYKKVFKREQPMNEYLYTAMKQITDSDGYLSIFHVNRDDGGVWLGFSWASPAGRWHLGSGFVFRFRKVET